MDEAYITRRGGSGGAAGLNFDIIDSIDYPQSKSRNLIVYAPYFHTTQTTNGLTFTDNGDGSVTVNGTASAMTHFRMSENTPESGLLYLVAGTYTLSGCPAGGSSTASYMLQAWDAENNTKVADDTGNGATFTLSEATAVRVAIVVQSGTVMSGLVFKPQLEKGSAATAFVKYKQAENLIWIKSENVKESRVKNYDFSATQPFLRSNNKNFLCCPYYSESGYVSAGITYTVKDDGTIMASGTATGTSIFRVSYGWEPETNCVRLEPGTYTLSGCPAGGLDSGTYVVELYKVNPDGTGNERFAVDTGNGVTFTLDKAQLVRCSCVIYSGTLASGLTFKPQLEKGSAATAFVKGDASGQVWVKTADASDMAFNALKKNGLQVYPAGLAQYINGVWTRKAGWIYQKGEWGKFASLNLYIVEAGEIKVGTSYDGMAATTSSGVLTIKQTVSVRDDPLYASFGPVDITPYTNLYVEMSGSDVNTQYTNNVGVAKNANSSQQAKATISNGDTKTKTINVSSLTGDDYKACYVVFRVESGDTKRYVKTPNIWFE